MFKVPNKKGFENIMHYLLNIVDPMKCAKVIPWPLLDRKAESQFRISVKIFLMEINSVSNVTAILHFVYCLHILLTVSCSV
jgi:hypothetical protein